jgi:hypothetical protein
VAAGKQERTIWVASKSSWLSSRSRQAKNLVLAKKLGRSEVLRVHRSAQQI